MTPHVTRTVSVEGMVKNTEQMKACIRVEGRETSHNLTHYCDSLFIHARGFYGPTIYTNLLITENKCPGPRL